MTYTDSEIYALLSEGIALSFGKKRNQWRADSIADLLTVCDAQNEQRASVLASQQLTNSLHNLYDNGWQPMDLVHTARLKQPPPITKLVIAAVLKNADATEAKSRAPKAWKNQLASIIELDPTTTKRYTRLDPNGIFLIEWLTSSGKNSYLEANDQWLDLLALLGQWQQLPACPLLISPPSSWPATGTEYPLDSVEQLRNEANSKTINKIRGLLSKAESTNFPEEAETLTAKAQELISRYSIHSALVDAKNHHTNITVCAKRIHITNPYPEAKVQLLNVIGNCNQVKSVWDGSMATATVVGTPVDIEQTELLFTSLLVQAVRAMSQAVNSGPKAHNAAFSKAFLYAYATRIGERLRQIRTKATENAIEEASSELLPALNAQAVAVEAECERIFPATTTRRGASLDAKGWQAGNLAANHVLLE
ncbi:MAG: DUF2786 domain-containing protein [Mycobacteriaceae bacterium]